MQKKDIPNAICWFRIFLIPFVLFFLVETNLTGWLPYWVSVLISGIFFTVAMVSDFIDGKIARKYNYISDLGKFLDPIADKMLVLSVCVAFCALGFSPFLVFAVIFILLRELLVTGLRLSAASKGSVVAANWWGKVKTTLQGITIGATYLCILLGEFSSHWVLQIIPEVFFLITAVFTCISAIPYIKACAPYLKG